MLGLYPNAYDNDDPCFAGLTSFLCFAFSFVLMLMLMLKCEPGFRLNAYFFTTTQSSDEPSLELTGLVPAS